MVYFMNKIIINGDDFGLTESVNESIRLCIEAGVMTSATFLVMRNKNAFCHGLEIAKTLKGKAGFGLHLDLDGFFRFDESGHYGVNDGDIAGNYKETIVRKSNEIVNSICCQIEILLQSGISISHVDSHHNIHLFPEMLKMIIPILKRYTINRVRFNENFYMHSEDRIVAKEYLQEQDVVKTDYFFDLSWLMGDTQLPGHENCSIEVMAHTDCADNSYGRVDQYNYLLNWNLGSCDTISFAQL